MAAGKLDALFAWSAPPPDASAPGQLRGKLQWLRGSAPGPSDAALSRPYVSVSVDVPAGALLRRDLGAGLRGAGVQWEVELPL